MSILLAFFAAIIAAMYCGLMMFGITRPRHDCPRWSYAVHLFIAGAIIIFCVWYLGGQHP